MRARFVVLGLLLACASRPAPMQTVDVGGAVAVAGTTRIDAPLVAAVARQTGRSPREALEALLFDAVLAQGATSRGLDATIETRQAMRAARARLVADRLEQAAAAKGPPTDAEIAVATERHWREVDIPEQARAVHAVVIADAGKGALAQQVAADLRRAVVGATSESDFLARAKQVDGRGLTIKPETLPLFVEDGRIVEGEGALDETFTRAAFALAPGETSGVVSTRFGLHVIRLLERLPARHVPLEERRQRFEHEVLAQRGHDELVALLGELKRAHPVVVSSAAEALMATAR